MFTLLILMEIKLKVGTASEIKKYERLLEQGALFSILIAKTPTGKIARVIEKKNYRLWNKWLSDY